MRNVILITMILLLALPLASASTVNILPVNDTANTIFFDETAQYDITIRNSQEEDVVFVWETNPVEWLIDTPSSARIPAGEAMTLPLTIRPRPSNFRGPGFYVVPITLRAGEEVIQSQLTVRIKNIEERIFSYIPSVALGASMRSEINPQDLVSVQLQIRNRNILDIDELFIEIDGQTFQGEDVIPLGGLEERTLEYRFDVDDALAPGAYELTARLIYQNKTISEVNRFYDVVPFSQITRDSSESTSFFKTTIINTLENEGNVQKAVTTNLSIPWYESLFTHVDIEAQSYEKRSRGVYSVQIEPQDTVTVTVVKNFRVLPVLVLLIILAIIAYFQFRSPIVLNKQTIVTGKDEEGTSEMRVRIFVRNRTSKSFYNVRLLDKAPSIAHVEAKGGLGVIEPSKIITSERKGTVIKWDFESLEAYEERIVTYTIKARLKIIGNLGLPPVRMKFETQQGRQRTTQSGKAVIGGR